jgi:hypothetical protein
MGMPDHVVRRLGADTYLITYVLRQGDRITRRATVWQSDDSGWRVLYHQGTVVSLLEEDAAESL